MVVKQAFRVQITEPEFPPLGINKELLNVQQIELHFE